MACKPTQLHRLKLSSFYSLSPHWLSFCPSNTSSLFPFWDHFALPVFFFFWIIFIQVWLSWLTFHSSLRSNFTFLESILLNIPTFLLFLPHTALSCFLILLFYTLLNLIHSFVYYENRKLHLDIFLINSAKKIFMKWTN